jgi:hypothetical protein
VKGKLHAQVKEPTVSVQVAFRSQLSLPFAHSSTLLQLLPSPANPVLQRQE